MPAPAVTCLFRPEENCDMDMETYDLADLERAKALLEHPGLAARMISALGVPLEKGFAMLPQGWHTKIGVLTQAALKRAIDAATLTLRDKPGKSSSNALHKIAVTFTGGVGGFLGLPALAMELPLSTTIMFRSIADIARSEGEQVSGAEFRMSCLEVFALGGPSSSDDAAESGYFAIRAALAGTVARTAEHVAKKGLTREGAPALARLIIQVAERFSIQVSEKAAAQAIPAIGAAGGAVVNTLFMDHFQKMARGHFIVRRLEAKYGNALVQSIYEGL